MKILFIQDEGYEFDKGEGYALSLKDSLLQHEHQVKILTSDRTKNNSVLFSNYAFIRKY